MEILPKIIEFMNSHLNPENQKTAEEWINDNYKEDNDFLVQSEYSVTQKYISETDILERLEKRRNIYLEACGGRMDLKPKKII